MKSASFKSNWGIITLLALFGVVWFSGLGYRPLFKTDEGRYAEISREMISSGNWVTPRLNGFRYFEKPPLQYWATAGAYRIFGVHVWSARLWTALAGFLTILLTVLTARALYGGRTGLVAGCVLAGSLYFGLFGHANTLDAGLTLAMTLTVFGAILGLRAPAQSRKALAWMLVAYAGAALAVLSKGLIGVLLPGATLVLYLMLKRDWSLLRRLYVLPGLAVFFAITLPWFVAVSLQNYDFLWQFFIVQQFLRFLTPISHRPGAWWYFLPILLIAMLPWLAATARAMARGARGLTRGGAFDPESLLWLWVVFIFLFFSVSHSKLPTYILPVIPALVLLVAPVICEQSRPPHSASVVSIAFGSVLLASGLFVPGLVHHAEAEIAHGLAPWVIASGCVVLTAGIGAFFLRSKRVAAVVLVSFAWLLATRFIMIGSAALAPNLSTSSLALEVAPYNRPDVPIYSVYGYQQTLPFYLRRTMTLVAWQGELKFGIDHAREPLAGRYIPTLQEFAHAWVRDEKGLAFAPREVMPAIRKLGIPYHVVASNPRWVAFVREAQR